MAMDLMIVNPSAGPATGKVRLASRPETLDGAVVGAIWNGRPHGDNIMRAVIELLQDRYKIKGVVFRRKPFLGNMAPPEIYDELTGECDVAICGVGD